MLKVKEYAGLIIAASLIVSAGVLALMAQKEEQLQQIPDQLKSWIQERRGIATRTTLSGLYLKAIAAQNSGDEQTAAQGYERALEINPDDPYLLEEGFRTALLAGETPKAELYANKLLGQGVVTEMDIYRLATGFSLTELVQLSGYIRNGDWPKSLSLLEDKAKTARKGSLQDVFSVLLQAWILQAQGQTDAARAIITHLQPRPEVAAFAHVHAALWYAAAGDEETALAQFGKVTNEDQVLPQRLTELYAHYLLYTGKPEESRKVQKRFWSKAQDIWWQDREMAESIEAAKGQILIDSPAKALAELLLGAASIFEKQGHVNTAMGFAQIAYSLNPDDRYSRLLLASLYEQQEDYSRVRALLQPVADPKSSFGRRAQMELAKALSRLGNEDAALKELRALAQQNPSHPAPWLHMADILRTQEKFKEAAEHYEEALQRMGKIRNHHWPILYMMGICYERSHQWEKAEPRFLKALELSPDNAEVLNYLGYSWLVQGTQIDRARDMIERAIKQRPYDGHIIDSMGWAMFKLGEYETALNYLERAVELLPADSTVNDHLGDIYWMIGRKREAYFQWERALLFYKNEGNETHLRAKLKKGYLETPVAQEHAPKAAKDSSL